jgi:hypothetical protein
MARENHAESRTLPCGGLELDARIEQLAQSLHDGKPDSFSGGQSPAVGRRL